MNIIDYFFKYNVYLYKTINKYINQSNKRLFNRGWF